MRYTSTRGQSPAVSFSEALAQSLAPDGGLFVPESFPRPKLPLAEIPLASLGAWALAPFLAGDKLESQVEEICREALTFPLPVVSLDDKTSLLELFHGPTAAFKDVGARFLGSCLVRSQSHAQRRLVLVATSGDTGGAVAAAFHKKPGIDVAVLFPKEKISPRQEKQLTSWGDNVRAFAVRGTFDDCQRLVKAAFADRKLREKRALLSANSISIGRLLPQQIYYIAASLSHFRAHGSEANFIVPTGNLGNAVACLWAKRMGFPIGRVVLATNANRPIVDYFEGGPWKARETVPTLANAMDVGNPSNMERLLSLYPDRESLLKDVGAVSVSDEEIRKTIAEGPRRWGQVFCPHTATAIFARERQKEGHWIVVATAHPAKFDTIVEPLIGQKVPVPPALEAILERDSRYEEISADVSELAKIVG